MNRLFLFCLCAAVSVSGNAQLNGAYSVPGNFTSIASAINSLNIGGVTGAVTINIAAGYTETTQVGGFQLQTISGCSSTSPVIFKKSGAGANPLVSAYTGGTASATSAIQDGIWQFVGSDYITIDGIDLVDPNINNPATMEFGYGFFKENAANGCQNNTIINCKITLNRMNGVSGTGSGANGSRCIDLSCTSFTANTTAITVTATSGANSGNKFYSNVLQNCLVGIALHGYAATSPFTLRDNQNDIGGLSAATGNTIINFGGGGPSVISYGIDALQQSRLNASFNYFNNNNGSGSSPADKLWTIYSGSANETDVSINSNTIVLFSASTSSTHLQGIYNNAGTSNSAPSVVNINQNIFPSYNFSNSINGLTSLILNNALARTVTINNNFIDNVRSGTAPMMNLIYCSNGATCSINNNTITNVSTNAVPATFSEIIAITAGGYVQTVNNNKIDNIANNSTTSGYVQCIYGGVGGGSSILAATNNTITNITGHELYGLNFDNFPNPYSYSVSANLLSGFNSAPGSTSGSNFTGMRFFQTSSVLKTSTLTINGNTISAVTSSGSAINSSNTGSLIGMFLQYHQLAEISKNKIYGLHSNGVGTVEGIRLNSNANVSNNLIGDLRISNSTYPKGIYGINAVGQAIVNLFYNTVYLNNTVNNGSNSGSTALFLAEYGLKTLKNNIFYNTSVSTGGGITSVLQLTAAATYTSYSTSSNNNLFYAGTPSPNSVILEDLKTSLTYSSLSAFKTFVSPRESLSVTEDPPFSTTVGSASNYLDIDPTLFTQVEGGAVPVTGITTDFAGTIRNTSTPDIGAWEGNYKKADNVSPSVLNSGFTAPQCNYTNRTFTLAAKDTSGIGTGFVAPRLYYKINSNAYTSVQGVLSSGTSSNGVWTFNLSYSGNPGDVISYFVVLQDLSNLSNVLVVPAAGAVAQNVNSVVTVPSSPLSYILPAITVITVNSGTICAGQSFQMAPSGAATYTFSGGSSLVSPTTNSVYFVTGSSALGCPASNTAIANVTVYATPTISVAGATICAGETFTLSPSGAQSFIYSGGSAVVKPSVTTTYSITGVSANGCLSPKVMVTVTVNAAPSLALSVPGTTICTGDSITLQVSGADSYTWQPGGLFIPLIRVSPLVTTTYSVTGAGLSGCSSTSLVAITVDPCVGLKDQGVVSFTNIYPVPANEVLHIEVNQPSEHILELTTVAGQLIRSMQLTNAFCTMDIKGLPNGLYMVSLIQEGRIVAVKKIILQ